MAIRTAARAPKSRRLKIGYSSYPSSGCGEARAVPYLRLRGYWLQQAGFDVNQNVRIQISNRRITVVPAD